MGFCRRCGDIVVGARCKCGGSAVAPVVKWNGDQEENQDRWSRTYVTQDKSPTRADAHPVPKSAPLRPSITGNGTSDRFSRPHSNTDPSTVYLGSRVSAHIATVTSERPSVLRHSASTSENSNPEEGILPNPDGSELSKVYGSVLQPKESLASFTCANCGSIFPPDATLFPDPSMTAAFGESQRFLCRPCFVVNGGSKGDCPSCHRPVLILKSEGGFVEASGKVWHRQCFRCDGCDIDLGDNPMVDLLGRPSCADCFDTCLKRPIKETPTTLSRGEKRNNGEGKRRETPGREGSPALEELELRLGIIRSRESTPTAADRGGRFSGRTSTYTMEGSPTIDLLSSRTRALSTSSTSSPSYALGSSSPSARLLARYKSPEPETNPFSTGSPVSSRRYSRMKSPEPEISTPSPRRSYGSPSVGSPAPTEDAIEEMKRRFLNQTSPSPAASPKAASTTTPTLRSRSRSRVSDIPSHPIGDYLDSSPTVTPQRSRIPVISRASPSPALRTFASTSSLRSAVQPQATGSTSVLQHDRTGESSFTLLRQRTGTSEFPVRSDFTGDTDYLPRQKTGNTTYLPQMVTGDTIRVVGRQRTGESLGTQHTGFGVFPQGTGGVALPLRSQKTGETIYEVRTQRTGDFQIRSHITGEELRYQGTGNDKELEDRTGDEEVESLVGTFSSDPDDLIDMRSSVSSGSMSKIPVPSRMFSSVSTRYSSNGLGLSGSNTSLSSYDRSIPSTPDLAVDMSDTMSTQSSGPSTPPSNSPPLRKSRDSLTKDVKATSRLGIDITVPHQLPPNARCAKCALPLFSTKHGGRYVTVPEEPTSTGVPPKMFHTSCFTCNVCHEVFEEREGGHAVFVRGGEGACHVRCAPPEKITLRRLPDIPMPPIVTQTSPKPSPNTTRTRSQTTSYATSSRYEPPVVSAAPIFPSRRFGASPQCPGCNLAVSQMERGVVPGPSGSRWHATCLVCGGKEAKGRRKEAGKAGCGKKLDSAAKTDAIGKVWCRECLLLLPLAQRQPSPVRSPILPNTTGGRGGIAPQITGKSVVSQFTGTTTIARQFTGLGGSDAALLRQLSGGGLSPTRQLSSSPTKMHDGPRTGTPRYPRPKSVTGVRSTTGEGRGMFLVRQLTGGNSSFSGNDYGL